MAKHYLNGAKWSLKNDTYTYGGTLDENGVANLTNIALGKYTFTLSKEGYVTKEKEITIGPERFNIDVNLEKIGEKPKKAEKPKTTKKATKKTTKKEEEKEVKPEPEPKKETKTKTTATKETKTKAKKTSKTSTKKATKKDEE